MTTLSTENANHTTASRRARDSPPLGSAVLIMLWKLGDEGRACNGAFWTARR